jgi:hypothetical protein
MELVATPDRGGTATTAELGDAVVAQLTTTEVPSA